MSKVAGAILERLSALVTSATSKALAASNAAASLLSYSNVGGGSGANALVQAGSAGLIESTFLPTPTETSAGAAYAATVETSLYYTGVPQQGVSGGTPRATAVGTTYAIWVPQVSANVYSSMACHITVVAAAAKTLRLEVYANGSDGFPGALVWYSANLDAHAATGVLASTFAAGTWVDTTYKTGNNLTVPYGSGVWLVLETDGTPNIQGQGLTVCRCFSLPTASFATVNTLITGTNTYGSGPVNPFGAATESSANVPMLCLLVV